MNARLLIALLICTAGTACAQPAPGTTAPARVAQAAAASVADELPIRRITMYRSGVASFERRGVVEGDVTTQLRFETRAVNDVLKSMLVLDLSGKGEASISYGSKEPLARRLASFGVDISDEPSLAALLARLRGSGVKVSLPDGVISGTILGGETRVITLENGRATIQTPFLSVVTPTGIRQVNLHQAQAVELADPKLAQELARALAAVDEQRAERIKAVDVRLSGEGRREIVAAYVLEAPVWKTSYRLVLPEGNKGQATVQGWAIVENTSDEDWKDVRLGLVSGRPVSFTMDLYEPLFTTRPEVPVPLTAAASPRAYAAGTSDELRDAAEPMPSPARARTDMKSLGRGTAGTGGGRPGAPNAPAEASKGMYAFGEAPAMELGAVLQSGGAVAAGVESGEVFQYELEHPVSIERQRSAMLPILSAPIEGRRLSIFNASDGMEHPMRGVEIVNTTDLQLIPGPISVYDAGAYAGDAQIGHVGAGDKRLLAYAVDLDVTCRTDWKGESNVRKVRIVKGILELSQQQVGRVEYALTNKDQKRSRLVMIEHPRDAREKLREPSKPAEETPSHYRFEVELAAGKAQKLSVVTERTDWRRLQLTEIDLPTLMSYRTTGEVSDAVVNAFKEASRRQGVISDLQRAIHTLNTERQAIDTDQNRIRQNMGSIDRTSQLYARYVEKLTEQETRLEAINREGTKLNQDLAKAQAELAAYIADLSVE